VQCCLINAALAAVSVRPITFGTLQLGGVLAAGGPLVVKVAVEAPVPTVIVALPAERLLDAKVLAPPETAIDVTADPEGAFSVTISTVPTV
jgi:hypothetical protein